jgi:hypothetical protein
MGSDPSDSGRGSGSGDRGGCPPGCAEVRAALAAGGPIDARHVAECAACAALLDRELGGSIADPLPPGEDPLVQAVMARVRADRAPLARIPTWVRHAAVWGAVAGSAGIAWGFGAGPRGGLDPAGGLLAAAVGAPVALRPLHRDRPRGERVRIAAALAIPLAVGLVAPSGPVSMAVLVGGLGCFVRGLAVAALVLGVLAVTERRTVGSLPAWLGGAALAGGAATLALALWCPMEATVHRVFAHGAPGLVAAAAVGVGVLGWRNVRG